MPWTCTSCGKLGEREGSDPSWCHRAGLATMKGLLQCCNCMRAAGWAGYDEYGCLACIRVAKRRLPIGSARRRAALAQVETAFSTLPVRPEPNLPKFNSNSLKRVENVKRVVVFEFDDVLFHTPTRPKWWPYNGYLDMAESLLAPAVPAVPDASWWNSEVVKKAKAAFADPETWSVLITYRGDGLKRRICSLLQQQEISFNEMRFRPQTPFLCELGATYTGAAGYGSLTSNINVSPACSQDKHTLVILGEVLSRCDTSVAQLELFATNEPSSNRAASLGEVLKSSSTREVQVHGIECVPHLAGTPTAAKLKEMIEMMEFEKRISRKGHVIPDGFRRGSARTGARVRRYLPSPSMQTVAEDAKEGRAAAHSVRSGSGAAAAKVVEWPADVYAGRHRLHRGWDEGRRRRNTVNFAKLCRLTQLGDWAELETAQDQCFMWAPQCPYENGLCEVWPLEGQEEDAEDVGEQVDEKAAVDEGVRWGWGGGIEFEWVDDAEEVMSMTDSCGWSAPARLEEDVLSMCSASVVGASDVMSIDSSWADDDDWRSLVEAPEGFEPESIDETPSCCPADAAAGSGADAAPARADGETPCAPARTDGETPCAPHTPYLDAVLSQPREEANRLSRSSRTATRRRQSAAASCVGGRPRALTTQVWGEDDSGDELDMDMDSLQAGPIGGRWKKTRNRREARKRLWRMLGKLDMGHFPAPVLERPDCDKGTVERGCVRSFSGQCCTQSASDRDRRRACGHTWIDLCLQRHKRTAVQLASV